MMNMFISLDCCGLKAGKCRRLALEYLGENRGADPCFVLIQFNCGSVGKLIIIS